MKPPVPTPDRTLVEEQAALWLARRDRGLTPAEQDDYLQWLRAHPLHAEVVAQQAAALERMMHLSDWQPVQTSAPNADLFAPAPALARWWKPLVAGLAAAAAIAVVYFNHNLSPEPVAVAAPRSYLRVNERMALPDGSRVELKDGTRIAVQYSETERRVVLHGGEAHFSVWKDVARPFVVVAAGVEVRAVGTAFNVRLGEKQVEVLVTEGRVKVEQVEVAGAPVARAAEVPVVTVGERAVVPLATPAPVPVIEPVTLDDIARELDWQAPRLQFHETPLAEAVAEFNRLNRHQLELAEPALGELRIGGTFRPDNVEGFIRSLEPALGVRGEPAGLNRTVLRRVE
jgi:transmembrane sensor